VSDQSVRSWGTSIPGLDVGRWHEDATSGDVSTLITADEADRDGVHSTPTLLLGPTGGTLTRLKLTSLDPEGTLPAVARALKPVAK